MHNAASNPSRDQYFLVIISFKAYNLRNVGGIIYD